MKKITSIVLALLMATSAFSMFGCKDSKKVTPMTRMTVDINPSVEFIIDENNKVVSATALNDDAGILLVGEAFVGKTSDEAVGLMLSVASETGYLVKGNVEADENTVSISVTGDKKVAQKLLTDIQETVVETLEELDIPGKVEKAASLAVEELREVAAEATEFTKEQLSKLDINEINHLIAQARVETALLLSEEMRQAYFCAKEYKLTFAEREETAKVIEALGGLYNVTHATYSAALKAYSTAIIKVDEFRYNMLVSPSSAYQKLLSDLRDAKVEFLKQRTYKASLALDDEQLVDISASLKISEDAYNAALTAFETIGTQMNESLVKLIEVLKSAETHLKGLEDTMFDRKIERKLKANADEMQATLNTLKDNFFTEFGEAHEDDIEALRQSLLAKKAELKAGVAEHA